MVEISPLFFIGGMMKTTVKQDKNIIITITYNNAPSQEAIRQYAHKLKNVIDSKMIAS